MLAEHYIQKQRAPERHGSHHRQVGGGRGDFTLQNSRCVLSGAEAATTPDTPPRWWPLSAGALPSRWSRSPGDYGRETPTGRRPLLSCYAVGWTQHTTGLPNNKSGRGFSNCCSETSGRPGGAESRRCGGHSSIQGSTDIPTLYNLMPGYIGQPNTKDGHETLQEFPGRRRRRPLASGMTFPSFMISTLKAWYGDNANQGERLLLRQTSL